MHDKIGRKTKKKNGQRESVTGCKRGGGEERRGEETRREEKRTEERSSEENV